MDQLDFECRALTSQGKITGLGQFLGAVGGTGGTAQGPYNCGTNNPAYALTGRSSTGLDSFGMQCRQATLTAVNSPPTIVNPGNLTGTVGVPVDITIGASDPDDQAVTFSASGLPTGLNINAGTGQITGTPTSCSQFRRPDHGERWHGEFVGRIQLEHQPGDVAVTQSVIAATSRDRRHAGHVLRDRDREQRALQLVL